MGGPSSSDEIYQMGCCPRPNEVVIAREPMGKEEFSSSDDLSSSKSSPTEQNLDVNFCFASMSSHLIDTQSQHCVARASFGKAGAMAAAMPPLPPMNPPAFSTRARPCGWRQIFLFWHFHVWSERPSMSSRHRFICQDRFPPY